MNGLLAVIAILGIMMLFLVPNFMGYTEDVKIQVRIATKRTVWTATKAVETQVEFKTITEGNCTSTVLGKLGSTFKSNYTTVTTDEKK